MLVNKYVKIRNINLCFFNLKPDTIQFLAEMYKMPRIWTLDKEKNIIEQNITEIIFIL